MLLFAKTIIALILCGLVVLYICGCSGCEQPEPNQVNKAQKSGMSDMESQKNRWDQILENYRKIEEGMTQHEVKNILGAPDEKHDLYELQKYNPRVIGVSWFYIKDISPLLSGYNLNNIN